jgi:hypothetical protein
LTRFSSRYGAWLAVLLLVSLALAVRGRLAPHRDECPGNEALLDAAAIDPRTTLRTEGPLRTKIAAGRVAGSLPAEPKHAVELALTIQRTYGLPDRLLQPASAIPGRHEPDDQQDALLETTAGALPIRYAYERRGRWLRVTAYFMTYRGKAVEDPLWVRLLHGPEAVLTGSFPITLFAIAGEMPDPALAANRERMDAWLRAAWLRYVHVCGPG